MCAGDIGGPLLSTTTGNIIGVASFATSTCDGPQIYTRIDAFIQWMEIVICANTRFALPDFCPIFPPPVPSPADPEVVPGSCFGPLPCEFYLVIIAIVGLVGFLGVGAVGFLQDAGF